MSFTRLPWLVLLILLGGCVTLTQSQRDRAAAIATSARSTELTCSAADHCAEPSALQELATRARTESSTSVPRHYAVILDAGSDALLARLELIRGARRSIDLQTYIFDEDDAGRLVLDQLLAAARRGVRVRLLLDQLSALEQVTTLAALSGAHRNLEMRIYNPLLNRARINYAQYVLAAACCFRRLNQRMHNKLLLIDGQIGITGGRNYQDDYYDWDAQYNFRDRDLLVAGPVADAMVANFEAFWAAQRSVPIERLDDVGRRLLRGGVPALAPAVPVDAQRVQAALRAAADPARMRQLAATALAVGDVQFVADLPRKHRSDAPATTDIAPLAAAAPSTAVLRDLIESAQREVLLQTPYLVLSPAAQQLFRTLHAREAAPRVLVSTNSLAATDAFFVYALSHKYKRRYLRDFGFEIYEYRPFPTDVPGLPSPLAAITEAAAAPATHVDSASPAGRGVVAASALNAPRPARAPFDRRSVQGQTQQRVAQRRAYLASRAGNRPVPLRRDGARMGLHSKSLVIDQRIGVVGTHNFDPRGDRYNTENAVIIDDPLFAQALAASIRRDMAPGNSWVIAPRAKLPLLSGLEYSLGKISEHLPLFDLWPTRYATSYEFVPSPACPAPLAPEHPRFRDCYRPVGDFPEVALGFKSLTTRIFTAFGAGLAPIL